MHKKPTYEELEKRVKELEELVAKTHLNQKAEKDLHPIEKQEANQINGHGQMDLKDLVDIKAIQSLMDDFFDLTNIGIAILDLKGKVLIAKGWQDICVKFHRAHPETAQNCLESDLNLSTDVEPGEFKIYRCKNNMYDMVTPIFVGNQKVGNLYLGQFIFDDEPPNVETFQLQAKKYSFDENEYLSALDRVPRWSRKTVNTVMNFYAKFGNLISELGYKNIQLKQSEAKYRYLFETMSQGVVLQDSESKIIEANNAACDILGLSIDQMTGKTAYDPRWKLIHEDGSTYDPDEMPSSIALRTCKRVKDVICGIYVPEKDEYRWIMISSTPRFKNGETEPFVTMTVFTDITARKNAEDSLKIQHYYLEKAQQLGNIGTWELDLINNILVWTDENCRIFGVPEGSVVDYETFISKVHPDDREYVDREWKAGVEGKPYDIEHRLLLDGEVKWVREKADVEFDDRGKAISAIGFTQDITEKKQTENALRDSEERFRIAGKVAYDLIYEWDTGTDTLKWFGDIDKLLGYSMGKISRNINGWLDLIHPDDKHHLENAVDLHRTSTKPIHYEYRIKHKDGVYRYWNDNAHPILDKKGFPSKWVGVCTDVTERKQAEEALRESEAQKQAILDSSIDSIRLVDKDMRIIWTNKIVEKLIHKDRSEILGEYCYNVFTGRDEPCPNCPTEKSRNSGEIEHSIIIEKNVKGIDGISYWADYAVPIKNDDGEIASFIQVSRDITELKKAERKLKESEEQYRQLFNNVNDAIFIAQDGKIKFPNPKTIDITGYPADELANIPFTEIIHP